MPLKEVKIHKSLADRIAIEGVDWERIDDTDGGHIFLNGKTPDGYDLKITKAGYPKKEDKSKFYMAVYKDDDIVFTSIGRYIWAEHFEDVMNGLRELINLRKKMHVLRQTGRKDAADLMWCDLHREEMKFHHGDVQEDE